MIFTDVCFTNLIVGWGIGTLAFGPLIESIGTRWSFRVAAVIAIVTCILFHISINQFMPPVKLVTQEPHECETNKEANYLQEEEDFKLNVKSDEDPQSNERELIKSSLLEGETKRI